jgi:hypothetical protein
MVIAVISGNNITLTILVLAWKANMVATALVVHVAVQVKSVIPIALDCLVMTMWMVDTPAPTQKRFLGVTVTIVCVQNQCLVWCSAVPAQIVTITTIADQHPSMALSCPFAYPVMTMMETRVTHLMLALMAVICAVVVLSHMSHGLEMDIAIQL